MVGERLGSFKTPGLSGGVNIRSVVGESRSVRNSVVVLESVRASTMGNSRNTNQKASGSRRPQTVENSTSRSKTPQKNIETMRVLSNIIIPSINYQDNQLQSWTTNPVSGQQQIASHPTASTSQHPGYFTEPYKNVWRPEELGNGQGTSHSEASLPLDIVNQALAEVINEGYQHTSTESKDVLVEMIHQMSPWSEDDFVDPEPKTASINNKSKGPTSTKKPRRSVDKEGSSSKRQKVKETEKPNARPNVLKQLLLEETTLVKNKMEKEAQSNTSTVTTNNNIPVIKVDDDQKNLQLDWEIFSQEADMDIFKKAITLKKKLVKEKETTDREFENVQQEASGLQAEIARLNEQLTATNKRLKEIGERRDKLTNKVKWVTESLG